MNVPCHAAPAAFCASSRGLLVEASGPAGDATFDHDGDGRTTVRSDAAGTTTYGWDNRGMLDTATLPTGTVIRWDFDPAGQPEVAMAQTADGNEAYNRAWHFNDLGRLREDITYSGDGSVLANRVYAYDDDGNPRQVAISHDDTPVAGTSIGQPQVADGTHQFAYDDAGRIESWTDPNGVETTYEWNNAHQRTRAGDVTYTYDERGRMLTGADLTYSWNPDGTLAQAGTTLYQFDALGRATNIGGIDYTYDGLDRIATRGLDQFAYADLGLDPVADPSGTYARSPAGRILQHDPAPTGGIDGVPLTDPDPVLTGLDRHGDLTWLIYPTTSQLAATRVYDPFGQPIGTTGTTSPDAGFQGDYTDPVSGEVWQGARWYQPNDGTFTARDTIRGELNTPVTLNRYLYANGSPLAYFDPDGRAARQTFSPDGSGVSREFINQFHTTPSPGSGPTVLIDDEDSPNALDDIKTRSATREARSDVDTMYRRQHPDDHCIGAADALGVSAHLCEDPVVRDAITEPDEGHYPLLLEQFAAEINRNSTAPLSNTLRALLDYANSDSDTGYGGVPRELARGYALSVFGASVAPNSAFDHKPLIEYQYEMKERADYYTPIPGVDKELYYDVWSNIHYGYYGRSVGLSEETLLRAQDLPGPIDGESSPADPISVDIGFQLFDEYAPGTLTTAGLDAAIRRNLDRYLSAKDGLIDRRYD